MTIRTEREIQESITANENTLLLGTDELLAAAGVLYWPATQRYGDLKTRFLALARDYAEQFCTDQDELLDSLVRMPPHADGPP